MLAQWQEYQHSERSVASSLQRVQFQGNITEYSYASTGLQDMNEMNTFLTKFMDTY